MGEGTDSQSGGVSGSGGRGRGVITAFSSVGNGKRASDAIPSNATRMLVYCRNQRGCAGWREGSVGNIV